METRKAKTRTAAMVVLCVCGILVYALIATGGGLEPSAPPGPTMHTLNEIFDTVDSLASGGLTYPEKFWIEQLFDIGGGGAQCPFLWLVIDGSEIEGECTMTGMEREGTIQCYGFDHEVSLPYDTATGQTTGARVNSPISIIKRTDKTTPLLIKALCLNEPVDSAEFRFYRPSLTGSGAEEHYLTVLLENAKIVAIRTSYPNIERVSFVFQDITWTYVIGGATHKYSWGH